MTLAQLKFAILIHHLGKIESQRKATNVLSEEVLFQSTRSLHPTVKL